MNEMNHKRIKISLEDNLESQDYQDSEFIDVLRLSDGAHYHIDYTYVYNSIAGWQYSVTFSRYSNQ